MCDVRLIALPTLKPIIAYKIVKRDFNSRDTYVSPYRLHERIIWAWSWSVKSFLGREPIPRGEVMKYKVGETTKSTGGPGIFAYVDESVAGRAAFFNDAVTLVVEIPRFALVRRSKESNKIIAASQVKVIKVLG